MQLNRSIFSVAITGASGASGTLIYHHAIPGTGNEVLARDGYYFLSKDDEYKAVADDHKEILKKNQSILRIQKYNGEDVPTKLKEGCKSELQTTYKKDINSQESIINLCTHNGIITVKARLMANGQNKFIVDESDSQRYYSIVFGIYRGYDKFIDGVKKYNKQNLGEEKLEIGTKIATGRLAIKSACETELKRSHKEVSDINYYTYLSWGCQKYKYETVEELIKSKDPSGELDEKGIGKGEKWKYTPDVMKIIAQGSNSYETAQKINDDLIKQGCNTNHKEKLDQNPAYTQTYTLVRYVCRKETNSD